MSEDRWQQIERIYQDALKITPEKRAAFLEETCRDMPDLNGKWKHFWLPIH